MLMQIGKNAKINLCEKQMPGKLIIFPILILSFGTVNNLLKLLRS